MAPKAMTPTSNAIKPGGYGDCSRRRRSNSKDEESSASTFSFAPIISSRFNTSPSKNARTHSPVNAFRRQRRSRARNLRTFATIAVDLIILIFAIRSISSFFSSSPSKDNKTSISKEQPSVEVPVALATSSTLDPATITAPEFTSTLPNTPACENLQPENTAYTLVLHLSDTRIWMMQQHCALWGELAPISVAIWTSVSKEEIMEKLKILGCDADSITLQTLSSENRSLADYPINKLRNLALSGVATSHALQLDVDMFPSIDLFDTLNLPQIRAALSSDPKLAVVVPAFESKNLQCGTSAKCRDRHLYWMPRDFEDLVISLGSNRALPYDSTHFPRQGSTLYRQWMRQSHGELVDIPCVSSNQYQPYMVVRVCSHLPPFQDRFVGYGRNNMAWMMHLRRAGYRLQQVGGSFVAHFPHANSQAKLEWEQALKSNENSGAGVELNNHLRGRSDQMLEEFAGWLLAKVDDESRLDKCDDFEGEEGNL